MMRVMGIYTIYPKPNLSKRYHAQYIRPYLLRNLDIERPDQVWGVDITYIRMQKGFMYLFIIIDWYSRRIVDYELSSTLEKSFVLNCLKRALSNRKPEIINSDQGGATLQILITSSFWKKTKLKSPWMAKARLWIM